MNKFIGRQKGFITIEYLAATIAVLILVFGIKVDEKTLWEIFQESFQIRHDNYSKTISNLDHVDTKNGVNR